jgi:type II secretory pathway component PulM
MAKKEELTPEQRQMLADLQKLGDEAENLKAAAEKTAAELDSQGLNWSTILAALGVGALWLLSVG